MAYRETWERTVPVLPGTDDDVLLWLLRESAEVKATGKFLKVIEFDDLGEIPRDDIPPVGLKQLGPEYAEATFRAFRIVAERDPDAAGV